MPDLREEPGRRSAAKREAAREKVTRRLAMQQRRRRSEGAPARCNDGDAQLVELRATRREPRLKASRIELERARRDSFIVSEFLNRPQVLIDAGRRPVLLLPVRIETRFFGDGSARELRVRIFPTTSP
jgi:hypothetical protein